MGYDQIATKDAPSNRKLLLDEWAEILGRQQGGPTSQRNTVTHLISSILVTLSQPPARDAQGFICLIDELTLRMP